MLADSEYSRLKQIIDARFDRAIAAAKAEHDKAIAQLDAFQALCVDLEGGDGSTSSPQPQTPPKPQESPVQPSLFVSPTKAARHVIREISAPFSIRELHPAIEKEVGRAVNRMSVASIINKLANETREIELVTPGSGRNPAYYRRRLNRDLPDEERIELQEAIAQ